MIRVQFCKCSYIFDIKRNIVRFSVFSGGVSILFAPVAATTVAHAADEVNVGFFLEWATPNQIPKVLKTYDDETGVPVNWTNVDAETQK